MERSAIRIDPTIRYQIFTLSVDPDGISRRIRVEIRYLNEPQLWYISMFDASTGEAFFRYVPIIASYEFPNDLLKPFRHKHIGSLYCVPVVSEPQTTDPGLDNLGEFELIWGDTDDT